MESTLAKDSGVKCAFVVLVLNQQARLSSCIIKQTKLRLALIQAEKTAHYVHELFLDNDDPELKEEIEIFSLQLQHRKVEFNACGFFKLDFTLLYSMIGAVTTYIIILMQFQKDYPADWQTMKSANCSTLWNHYSVADLRGCLNDSLTETFYGNK